MLSFGIEKIDRQLQNKLNKLTYYRELNYLFQECFTDEGSWFNSVSIRRDRDRGRVEVNGKRYSSVLTRMQQLLDHSGDGVMLQKLAAIIEENYKSGELSGIEKIPLMKTYYILMDEWRLTQK